MGFYRGFKAHANRISLEVREELGLGPRAPLCPWRLAESLGIPVVPLRQLKCETPDITAHVDYLTTRGSQHFSAITVFRGNRRLIVHNDSHAPTRQRSNLAHELAHALLMHRPHPPFCAKGERFFDSTLEREASWLGPVLLVPNEAAHWAAATGLTAERGAQHFDVSEDLMRFRLRVSGAARLTGSRAASAPRW